MVRLKIVMIRAASLAAALWSAVALAADPLPYAESDFARIDKIDAHVHVHGTLPVFMARAAADGFRVLTINVNYADFPPLPKQFDDALALQRAYPDRVAFAASFDAAGSEQGDWLARTERQLTDALGQGAVAVKVWKDIGMQQRDADGRAVMIDDARFTPLFRLLEQRHVTLLGHQGEPRNAWLPLQEMTIRADREYFAAHPQYHMVSHPEWPSYEQQLAARDRMLDRHPNLQFVGVHLASLEWDVGRVAGFLQRYPNASVDLAARLVHLELQASQDRDKVRRFFIAFQDRILYGSDLQLARDQSDAALAEAAHEAWLADWRFLSGDALLHSTEFDAPFRGLALPRSVIDKIYRDNARRLFPGAWRSAPSPSGSMKTQPAPLEFANPSQSHAKPAPVTVTFAREGASLLAHFKVTAAAVFAKRQLGRGEYPYDFDVVELFVTNAKSGSPTYYEFEVSPYNQSLQVNVVAPRQEYCFGVKNGFTHKAVITAGGWEAEMNIPLASLGWDGKQPLQLIGNAYAALGEKDQRVYWSLFELPAGKPDFHVPSAFRPLFGTN
jgi:hypothetical protein